MNQNSPTTITHTTILHYDGIDILKTIAIFCIIAGHFFIIHTPFKEEPFDNLSMFIQGCFMNFFLIGVPLFVTITGFLNSNKSISKRYYFKIFKVLIPYVLLSTITLLFRVYYQHEDITFLNAIEMIFAFSAIPYAWYIEMWIGLYLLSPFLNILYHGLGKKTHKILLIILLSALTALPNGLNIHEHHIVPSFWESIWPLTCYFIGCYIKEFQPAVNKKWLILSCLLLCTIVPIFNILTYPHHDYMFLGGTQMLHWMIMVSIFLLFYKVHIDNVLLKNVISTISHLSLYMYLTSFIFDSLYYPYFIQNFYCTQSQFGICFFAIIPVVFISSFFFSWIIKKLLSMAKIQNIWEYRTNK